MLDTRTIVIIGAGPAGLTAAYELAKHGISGHIFETDEFVGGLARTIERDGYRFDVGAHRFFTKVAEIGALWEEMLGEPLLKCRRLTRILYNGKFYNYPLEARNALKNMGLLSATACLLSYARARSFPLYNPANFEQWVTNKFGKRLFSMFFKSYTEKVWGRPCTEIGADWAAQRIKGLDLWEAVRNAIMGRRLRPHITTLIDEFHYPRRGAGQIWERCSHLVQERGWILATKTRVTSLHVEDRRVITVSVDSADLKTQVRHTEQVLSSIPLRELLHMLQPRPPIEVLQAASELSYRDFLIVALVLNTPQAFPDNWIYIHSPKVRVARIDNFDNWSNEMVPNQHTSCLLMEYFVFEHDELWVTPDEKLVDLAYAELQELGLSAGGLVKGFVTRVPKAYPVYDPGYKTRLDVIRSWLTANVTNLQCIGRNGQHRYNNQDHSMATALIAARNIAFGQQRDPWAVNEHAEYHEIALTEREAPLVATP